MNTWSLKAVVLALVGMNSVGSAALAADLPSTPQPLPPLALEDSWKFQATFYGWATAINGKVGIRGLPPANVNVTFADILKNLNGAVMGSFYASNGKWMILTDVVWAKLSDHVDVGPFGGQVKFEQQQAIVSGVVGYRLPIGPDNLNISATAGARYNYLDAKFDFLPGILPIQISREGTKSWVDPTVGVSVHYDINDRWFVNGLADIGGFGVGSKITAQGFATIGYNWTKTISTAIGYRTIYTDYKDGGFVYNTTQHGVFTSIGIHF
jgi:hypothetical protein